MRRLLPGLMALFLMAGLLTLASEPFDTCTESNEWVYSGTSDCGGYWPFDVTADVGRCFKNGVLVILTYDNCQIHWLNGYPPSPCIQPGTACGPGVGGF